MEFEIPPTGEAVKEFGSPGHPSTHIRGWDFGLSGKADNIVQLGFSSINTKIDDSCVAGFVAVRQLCYVRTPGPRSYFLLTLAFYTRFHPYQSKGRFSDIWHGACKVCGLKDPETLFVPLISSKYERLRGLALKVKKLRRLQL